MLRFQNIKIRPNDRLQLLPENLSGDSMQLRVLIQQLFHIPKDKIKSALIIKESVDARFNIPDFILTIDVCLLSKEEEQAYVGNHKKNVKYISNEEIAENELKSKLYQEFKSIKGIDCEDKNEEIFEKNLNNRPFVIGAGPAGLFAALWLALQGKNPVLIDRGANVKNRTRDLDIFQKSGLLNTDSNVQFGEGGAGAFSDGKLSTGIKSPILHDILSIFVECGAPADIMYRAAPHIGTDKLKPVVKNLRKKIESLGATVLYDTKLSHIEVDKEKIVGVKLEHRIRNEGGDYKKDYCKELEISTDTVLLCIGHSARDTIKMLYNKGVVMIQKPFAMGVRIEQLQTEINRGRYHDYAEHKAMLPASYNLNVRTPDKRGVFTFCMCPGGEVIEASSNEGETLVNGMSMHSRNNINANSAVLVGVTPDDFKDDNPLSGFEFQSKFEKIAYSLGGSNYKIPVQTVGDFLQGKTGKQPEKVIPSCKNGYTVCDISECLPSFVVENLRFALPRLNNKLNGFSLNENVLSAIESRSSSPVRILRDEAYQSNIKGLYPIGEGAGFAGGIMSSAVDGVKVAQSITQNN